VSAGNIGFKKAQRGTYDAAYQLASHVFAKLEEKPIRPKALEVVLRDFGEGREAVVKALLGTEGRNLKGAITRVTDATRLKFGGTRSKAPRRLVGELSWLVACGIGGLTLPGLGLNAGGSFGDGAGLGVCYLLCHWLLRHPTGTMGIRYSKCMGGGGEGAWREVGQGIVHCITVCRIVYMSYSRLFFHCQTYMSRPQYVCTNPELVATAYAACSMLPSNVAPEREISA